jgi:hypothetical protein
MRQLDEMEEISLREKDSFFSKSKESEKMINKFNVPLLKIDKKPIVVNPEFNTERKQQSLYFKRELDKSVSLENKYFTPANDSPLD